MSAPLAARCRAFLERPVPKGVRYVPDAIAERILRLTAAGKELDEELAELLFLCIPETREAAAGATGEARAWWEESASLLEEIAEVSGPE